MTPGKSCNKGVCEEEEEGSELLPLRNEEWGSSEGKNDQRTERTPSGELPSITSRSHSPIKYCRMSTSSVLSAGASSWAPLANNKADDDTNQKKMKMSFINKKEKKDNKRKTK